MSSTAVVEFDGALSALPGIGLLVPSKVELSVTEVSLEVRCESVGFSWDVAVGSFHQSPCEDHLSEDQWWHFLDGGESARHAFGSRETNTGIGCQVPCKRDAKREAKGEKQNVRGKV